MERDDYVRDLYNSYLEECTSFIEIGIQCRNLKKMDLLSKSDPFCVLYLCERDRFKMFDSTEVKMNNHDPNFMKSFVIPYYFEEQQILKFSILDWDKYGKNELIGEVILHLGEIVSSGKSVRRKLKIKENDKHRGEILITAEEIPVTKFRLKFQISCANLPNSNILFKSNPYLEITKQVEAGYDVIVHKTEVNKRTQNPNWEEFILHSGRLCGADLCRQLKFSVYHEKSKNCSKFIGSCITTFREISPEYGNVNVLQLANKKKRMKKRNKDGGTIIINKLVTIPRDTFTDYLKGGLQIALHVAVDFTASNLNPSQIESLHCMNGNGNNDYLEAIMSVCSVLGPYDSDQLIPVYGFGAKLPPYHDRISHCFPLNGNEDNPEVLGVKGIIDVYKHTLRAVKFCGPTCFGEILSRIMKIAEKTLKCKEYAYHILLILTDGVISDMRRTIDLLVQASTLPLSVVIVGVGNADFTNMAILDADYIPLRSSSGETMKRDIVQFIPLREVRHRIGASQFSLAREILAEIPEQVVKQMHMNSIRPRLPVARQSTISDSGIGVSSGIYGPIPKNQTSSFMNSIGVSFTSETLNSISSLPLVVA